MLRCLWLAMTAAMLGLGSHSAAAMGFCSCCEAAPGKTCAAQCAALEPTPGQCLAIVDFKGKGQTKRGVNPLNGISLKEISLGNPSGGQLEKFRRFMERQRRAAVKSQRRAIRSFERRRISEAEYQRRSALYKEALVNYYHGIRAYLTKVGTKKD